MSNLLTIYIDWSFLLNFWNNLAGQPTPFHIAIFILQSGGWIPVAYLLWRAAKLIYLIQIQMRWGRQQKYVLLAIDVPKGNEQSPKAVENIFAHFFGMKTGVNFKEKWRIGKFQLSSSVEIVSYGGDIQFYIRTPLRFRDLVEAAVFSQYPDAEITEVEDYALAFPREFPNDKYNMSGCDFKLEKDAAYPLRTYPAFEHTLSGEFKDPMSLVMEAFGRVPKGEWLAMQILITPTGEDWRKEAQKFLHKMLGKKTTTKQGIAGEAVSALLDLVGGAVAYATGAGGDAKKDEKKDDAFKMMNLTPGERRVIENIEYKLAKTGFLCKVRYAQIGPIETFRNKFGEIKGFLRQFAILDSNSFSVVGSTVPSDDYFWDRWFKALKQRALTRAFVLRDSKPGGPKYALNIEELATLWHFPVKEVKAPKIVKTQAKTAEPPRGLPIR